MTLLMPFGFNKTQPGLHPIRYHGQGSMLIGVHLEGSAEEIRFKPIAVYVTDMERLEAVYVHRDREGR